MVTKDKGLSVVNGETRTQADYYGLSTDTKPTDCGINSIFIELDTAKKYYFTGEAWTEIGG